MGRARRGVGGAARRTVDVVVGVGRGRVVGSRLARGLTWPRSCNRRLRAALLVFPRRPLYLSHLVVSLTQNLTQGAACCPQTTAPRTNRNANPLACPCEQHRHPLRPWPRRGPQMCPPPQSSTAPTPAPHPKHGSDAVPSTAQCAPTSKELTALDPRAPHPKQKLRRCSLRDAA